MPDGAQQRNPRTLDDIVEAARARGLDPRREAGEWKFPCPAAGHPGDGDANCSAYEKNGEPRVTCNSHRCHPVDILKGLGLWDDARTPRRPPRRRARPALKVLSAQDLLDEDYEPPRLGTETNPFPDRDMMALSSCLLDRQMNFRLNTRAKRIEWARDGRGWQPVTDTFMDHLRDQFARQYYVWTHRGAAPLRFGRERWSEAVNALVHEHRVDPFRERLEDGPAWDGERRIDEILSNLFGTQREALEMWAGRFVFLGAVERTYRPGAKLDEIPVFIGDQGIGKSAFLRCALPPDMPDLYSDGLRWDARPGDQVDATLGKVIVEVSEMAGRGRAEIEAMKAYISRQDDGTVRRPYARHPEPLPRQFIICGTTNRADDLPNDPSGNRRFVPVELGPAKCAVETYMDAVRDQCWAEALELFRDGESARLPRSLRALQRDRAEAHRDRDDLVEDVIAGLPKAGEYKLGEIITAMGAAAVGIHQRRIINALRNAGWKHHRTMHGRFWTPPA